MEITEYKVIYQSGKEHYFYCKSFPECVVTAMYFAYAKGEAVELTSITDGITEITDIVVSYKAERTYPDPE